MRIGELAAATGASVRSLRHYEASGLISASRSAAGQRVFDVASVERVRLVRQLLAAGLGVRAIAEVLPCLSDPASQTVALTERLVLERDRLDEEVAARLRMREALEAVISAAPVRRPPPHTPERQPEPRGSPTSQVPCAPGCPLASPSSPAPPSPHPSRSSPL